MIPEQEARPRSFVKAGGQELFFSVNVRGFSVAVVIDPAPLPVGSIVSTDRPSDGRITPAA